MPRKPARHRRAHHLRTAQWDACDDQPFKISKKLARAISEEFGFTLTRKEIIHLGIASQGTISFRRLVLRRNERDAVDRRRGAVAERQKRIAKGVDQLLRELKADDLEGIRSGNLTFKMICSGYYGLSQTNALTAKAVSCFNEVAPTLRWLRELSTEPDPLPHSDDKSPKLRRRKNVDHEGWDLLILAAMQIFRRRGKPPTANYIRKRGYTSALLRGLEKLHDALPADVRAPFASALGSPTAEWIKKSNRNQRSPNAVTSAHQVKLTQAD